MEHVPVRVSDDSDLLGMREAVASLVGTLVVGVYLRSGPILGISLAGEEAATLSIRGAGFGSIPMHGEWTAVTASWWRRRIRET
jgi:hypothetical protein